MRIRLCARKVSRRAWAQKRVAEFGFCNPQATPKPRFFCMPRLPARKAGAMIRNRPFSVEISRAPQPVFNLPAPVGNRQSKHRRE